MSNYLSTYYQQFIGKSRYARWLEDQGRREDWPETVSRYIENIVADKVDVKTKYEIEQAILNLDVAPSMRGLMTAGEALFRDNTCLYNCAYTPVEKIEDFDKAMFILLCGTGVGFSVERQYVSKLPSLPESFVATDEVYVVEDSKEGWAKSLRKVMKSLYKGEIIQLDYSRVRPAGARLKTFGGRASGPAPLKDLFSFIRAIFVNAAGRKLTSIECHDIMCKIGEVVVVGGVRRSAMISLSNLSDDRMRHAKSGNWWENAGHRALANNSVAYTDKPDMETFMREWLSLVESKSGERGIFSRPASINKVKENGRRDPNWEFGTNPCSEIILRPRQFCNLTSVMVRATDTVDDLARKVRIASILGTIQSTFTNFPYLGAEWERNTKEERLLGVSLTGIMDSKLTRADNAALPKTLQYLKQVAVDTNKEFANRLGIPESTAVTCVKPEGTVSQLVDTASGIHARHSPYYIRTVRGDNKDPLTQFLKDSGIPSEPCVMKPDTTTVFSFPQKSPEGAITRNDMTALEQLELWLIYQRHWCEHKPSVTITVRDHEWLAVGDWVYKNFNEVSGVSFLPHSDHTYQQAPYQDCTKEEYEEALANMPTSLNWDLLKDYETDDQTKGSSTFNCTGGMCEIVDLT